MGILTALVHQQLALHEPKEEEEPPAPLERCYDWIPDALAFIESSEGEVTTLQIHTHVSAKGRVPNRQSMSNTLTRIYERGRAPGLTLRLLVTDRGFYKVNYWGWRNDRQT